MINLLLDLLYPPACELCDALIPNRDQILCIACKGKLACTDYHLLRNNPVAQHFWGRLEVERATAYLHFKKQSHTQQLIHQLKYENRPDVGVFLGLLAAQGLCQDGFLKDVDLILPVPLYSGKQKKRGYNQAERIAHGLSIQSGITVSSTHLIKSEHTESQTKKSRAKRFTNVRDSFELKNAEELDHRHLLIVDDVITTGSTLEACGRLLKDSLNCRLSIFTLAATD